MAAVQMSSAVPACLCTAFSLCSPSQSAGIYKFLDSGTAFEQADELLKATGLYDYTQV